MKKTRKTTFSTGDPVVKEWLEAQSNISKSIEILIANQVRQSGNTDLSKGKLPNTTAILNETLKVISAATVHRPSIHVQEIYSKVSDGLKVDPNARNLTSTPGGDNIFEKRVRFSLLKLRQEGFVDNPKRGFYSITNLGKFAADKNLSPNDYQRALSAQRINRAVRTGEIV